MCVLASRGMIGPRRSSHAVGRGMPISQAPGTKEQVQRHAPKSAAGQGRHKTARWAARQARMAFIKRHIDRPRRMRNLRHGPCKRRGSDGASRSERTVRRVQMKLLCTMGHPAATPTDAVETAPRLDARCRAGAQHRKPAACMRWRRAYLPYVRSARRVPASDVLVEI
jgi:hypothetical protein